MKSEATKSFPHRWAGDPQPVGDLRLIAHSQQNRLPIEFTLDPFGDGGRHVRLRVAFGAFQQIGDIGPQSSLRFGLCGAGLIQHSADDHWVDRKSAGQQERLMDHVP